MMGIVAVACRAASTKVDDGAKITSGQLRALNRLRAEALGDLAIGIDASLSGQIDGPVWSVSDRGTAGAFRSSRADSGSQVLPPARATVPPWLPENARVPYWNRPRLGSERRENQEGKEAKQIDRASLILSQGRAH